MTLFLFLISWPSGDKNQRLQLIVQAENPWRAHETILNMSIDGQLPLRVREVRHD